MTPKQRAIFATLPVAVRAAAQAYYDELDAYEKELSEFNHAQTKLMNAQTKLRKVQHAVESPGSLTPGKLYVNIQTGRYYESCDSSIYHLVRLKNDGYPYIKGGRPAKTWRQGPLVELAPDDPFREKRRVASICNKLEGGDGT